LLTLFFTSVSHHKSFLYNGNALDTRIFLIIAINTKPSNWSTFKPTTTATSLTPSNPNNLNDLGWRSLTPAA
jgi:hypothetical protein